ncbi:MAG: hypothetical protein JXA14_25130 [Anaerolineae bacterium]|jgi:hypothetical protein|nr:hypothetical protein [Anaerolineae bacterium]
MDEVAALSVVPCAGFSIFFVLIFGTIALLRWFRHKEIMAMAEKGLLPDQYAKYLKAPQRRGRGFLVWGLVLAGLGLALVAGLLPIAINNVYMSPLLLLGLMPLFVGLGLLIVYVVMRKEDRAEKEEASAEINVAGD